MNGEIDYSRELDNIDTRPDKGALTERIRTLEYYLGKMRAKVESESPDLGLSAVDLDRASRDLVIHASSVADTWRRRRDMRRLRKVLLELTSIPDVRIPARLGDRWDDLLAYARELVDLGP